MVPECRSSAKKQSLLHFSVCPGALPQRPDFREIQDSSEVGKRGSSLGLSSALQGGPFPVPIQCCHASVSPFLCHSYPISETEELGSWARHSQKPWEYFLTLGDKGGGSTGWIGVCAEPLPSVFWKAAPSICAPWVFKYADFSASSNSNEWAIEE